MGSGDLGHEVTSRQLGEYPGVDLVGLGGPGRQALHRVTHRDVPTVKLELVVDEAGSRHRLDRCGHLPAVPQDVGCERAKGIGIGADGRDIDGLALLIEHVDIEPLAR